MMNDDAQTLWDEPDDLDAPPSDADADARERVTVPPRPLLRNYPDDYPD
jgi:hypothetical protein